MAPVTIGMGFADIERKPIGALYWEAFETKLSAGFRDRAMGERVVTVSLRADRMLVARIGSEVVGVCGFYRDGRGAADLSWPRLREHLSWTASAWASITLSVLSRRGQSRVLVLDGICVSDGHRGRGIGSLLLAAADEFARDEGDTAVQLSVIDSNPRAEALYRRRGFEAVDRGSLGPLRHLYGFDRYTTVHKRIEV